MGPIAISLAIRRVLNAAPVPRRLVVAARLEAKLPYFVGPVILLQASLTANGRSRETPQCHVIWRYRPRTGLRGGGVEGKSAQGSCAVVES